MSRRIAVVGAGMAASRFAQQFHAAGGEGEVTLYGAEPHAPYNRVLLADVLTGRYSPGDLALPTGAARVRTGGEVVAVDRAARLLRLACGRTHGYDELVLATGANPVLPPLRGLRSPTGGPKGGVHSFRTVADCGRLTADADRARRAVVIGGGVLGVSAARALAARGLPVEIVHQGPHLIERHLDAEAAAFVERGLRELGVRTYARNRARALHGERHLTGVELATGHVLDAELAVLACGVRPRTGLAHACGLPVRNGVLVDDALRCAPDVYAIGDCAEHRGTVHGLSGPGWEQADVLAARLSGADPHARYAGSHRLARLTAGPLEYAAFGAAGDGPGDEAGGTDVLRIADATRGSYRKLVRRGDRLIGGILLGDLSTVSDLTRAWRRGEALPPDASHLLTAGSATATSTSSSTATSTPTATTEGA